MRNTEDRRKYRGLIQMIVVCLMSLLATVAPAAAPRVTGTINKPTYKLGPEQLSAEDKQAAPKLLAAAKD
jgi:hypothetical protein